MEATSIEFEIKAALSAAKDADDVIQALQFLKREVVTDVYFDTIARDLFQRGVFVRVRNSKIFEIKYNSDTADFSHLKCEEQRYSWPLKASDKGVIFDFLKSFLAVPDGKSERDPFAVFDLKEFVRIVKDRAIYYDANIEVSLDHILGLGDFLEIEARGLDGVKKVEEFCAKRGLKNLSLGYVELWLRKNDFSTYRLGKYVLTNDRISNTLN